MGSLSNANNVYLLLVIFPNITFSCKDSCKLVPVQHRENENGLLTEVLSLSKRAKISENKSG